MNILVTGGTGFVGSHLVRRLVENGDHVRVLVRKTSNIARLAQIRVEFIEGDITDINILNQAANGVDVIYHCAAYVSDWGPRHVFLQTNVNGTENVARACLLQRVPQVIHVSSLAVLDRWKNHYRTDEKTPYATKIRDYYTESKILSERLLLHLYATEGLPVTIVRPGIVWGPGDDVHLPRLVEAMKFPLFSFVDGGRNVLDLTHIRNLVEALVLVLKNPISIGAVYNITDNSKVTAREFFSRLASELDLAIPNRSLPFWMLYTSAVVMEWFVRASQSNRPPKFTRFGVCEYCHNHDWDISKAQRELGYKPECNFENAVREIAQWYRDAQSR